MHMASGQLFCCEELEGGYMGDAAVHSAGLFVFPYLARLCYCHVMNTIDQSPACLHACVYVCLSLMQHE